MINEDNIEQLRNEMLAQGFGNNYDHDTILALIDMSLALWKIARAARKWVNASAGPAAVLAEAELVKSLEGIKEPNVPAKVLEQEPGLGAKEETTKED